MNDTKNKKADLLEWRSERAVELYSEGRNQSEIAQILKISQPTVYRDLQYQREKTRNNVKLYLEEYLPFEHDVCHVGINRILKKAWDIINNEGSSEKAVFKALHLAKDCYAFKHELRGDNVTIDRAIDFVQSHKELRQPEVQSEVDSFYARQQEEEYSRSQRVF